MDAADVLMSENFGAFGGLKVNQTSALKGLEAQETLGKIAMQPAQQKLAESHARLYEASAEEKEESVRSQKRLAELIQGLPPGGSEGTQPTPTDLANQMLRLSGLAAKSGLIKDSTELATKASTILQHVASAAESDADAALQKMRRDDIILDMVGGLAQSGLESQTAYDAARMAALNDPVLIDAMKKRGFDITKMPTDFNRAKPALQALVTQTMKAKDKLAQDTRDRVAKAEIAKDGAAAQASIASAKAADANLERLNQIIADVKKNDGDTTGGARDLRAEKKKAIKDKAEKDKLAEEARARKQASIDAARFTPVPKEAIADPSKREVGRTYMTPKGPLTWTGQGWKPLVEARLPAAPADEDDDED